MQDSPRLAAALEARQTAKSCWSATCPACGYPKGLSITEMSERTLLYCHACRDQNAVLDALRSRGLWPGTLSDEYRPHPTLSSSRPESASRTLEIVRRLWANARPLAGSSAESYLIRRGLSVPWPSSLSYLPDQSHRESGQRFGVLLAAVTRWPGDEVVAVHRTYITNNGHKADVDPAKKSLGFIKGGAVRLAPAGPTLALSEGIETGLAFMVGTCLPTWACLSTGGLRAVVLPALPLVREVVVAADHDMPGLDAARAAAIRFSREGRRVRIALPPQAGQDFADLLREATL